MTSSADPKARRRLIALITVGVLVLVLAGIGVYGLLTGPAPRPDAPGGGHDPAPTATTPDGDGRELPAPRPVVASDDPEEFARNVATSLFTWDTGSGLMPLDYQAIIVEAGDPSGTEQAGLANDVAAYLPSREAWTDLRQYDTSQHLDITSASVPAAWEDALSQAQPGQIAEGTTAITIEGTRHRDGVWNDEPVTSTHEVAFTVFVVCGPTYDTCHLLRLSELDNPLR
ncbi:hypothetical protein [Brachybacterium tyrofermentans]|uniref:hypothetical protein n=1 Tax=Brachybacterium tyrofermentans TaxID=47848 RepID=UPI003FD1F633